MDLKSGCMLWTQQGHKAPETRQLTNDQACDVTVIGAGISGALAAYYLTLHGIETILVDCRSIAAGSTSASTGLLQYELDTSLLELTARIGNQRAIAAYLASLDALRAFGPLIAELDHDCGYRQRPSLYLASEQRDVATLINECDLRKSIGIDISFLDHQSLLERFGIDRPAALLSSEAAEVDPVALTHRLIEQSMQRGLRVFTETQIIRREQNSATTLLHTPNGATIRTGRVVVATGYETLEFLSPRRTEIASTYAIASEPVDDSHLWRDHSLIWETSRPYLYLRTTSDNQIIVGGADDEIIDPARRDALIPAKVEELMSGFQRLFPDVQFTPSCAWTGIFASTQDGLPFIGTVPQFPDCLFALGYGGNGITFSLLAAKIITAALLGQQTPLAPLFSFDR